MNTIEMIKKKLDESIELLCDRSKLFLKHPDRDFTRTRKLSFRSVISFLLSMEGGTLTNELLDHFGFSENTASASAFVQQRGKIIPDAFHSLFDTFVEKTASLKRYKGLCLLAADGSDIHIPTNPHDPDSYYSGANGQQPYNLFHLNAMYDLLQKTYVDAVFVGKNKSNEQKILCNMVDRSRLEKTLIIADRGYENYNLMAHIQEKGWFFLIRIREITFPQSIAFSFDLPATEEFDLSLDLSITSKQSNEVKSLLCNRNQYHYLPTNCNFDYLPKKNRKNEPAVFYHLPFRIVRFKITDASYETVVTNLNPIDFPPEELKNLYNMRWGIETSFRELKHTIGLLHFHAKKVEYIYQEVFARMIMYNFAELVTSSVIIQKTDTKYAYIANFTVAVHVCRQFLLGNVSPPIVEAVIHRHVSPIRPSRNAPRKTVVRHAVSFTYRIA